MKWSLDKTRTGIVRYVIDNEDSNRVVAQVYVGYRSHIKPNAITIDKMERANLIAAAPDLLEACKAIMQAESTPNADVMEISTKGFERCAAAIHKAENAG